MSCDETSDNSSDEISNPPPTKSQKNVLISKCCDELSERGDIIQLEKFLRKLPRNVYETLDSVAHARATLLYLKNQHRRLRELLRSRTFSKKYTKNLKNIWYNSFYKTNNIGSGPGDQKKRLMIQKRNQPPVATWSGQQSYSHFKKSVSEFLKNYYEKNSYPDRNEKRDLSLKLGLTFVQVKNWFKNRRQRYSKSGEKTKVPKTKREDLEDLSNMHIEQEEMVTDSKKKVDVSNDRDFHYYEYEDINEVIVENNEQDNDKSEEKEEEEEVFKSVFDSPEPWDVKCILNHNEELVGSQEEHDSNFRRYQKEVRDLRLAHGAFLTSLYGVPGVNQGMPTWKHKYIF